MFQFKALGLKNGCVDALIIMKETEYYAERLILLSSLSGCALYV